MTDTILEVYSTDTQNLNDFEKQVVVELSTADGKKDSNVNKVLNSFFTKINPFCDSDKEKIEVVFKDIKKTFKKEYKKTLDLGLTTRYFDNATLGKVLSTLDGYIQFGFYLNYGLSIEGFKQFLKDSGLVATIMLNKVKQYYDSLQGEEEEKNEVKEAKTPLEKTLSIFLNFKKNYDKLSDSEKLSFALQVKPLMEALRKKQENEKKGISKE